MYLLVANTYYMSIELCLFWLINYLTKQNKHYFYILYSWIEGENVLWTINGNIIIHFIVLPNKQRRNTRELLYFMWRRKFWCELKNGSILLAKGNFEMCKNYLIEFTI